MSSMTGTGTGTGAGNGAGAVSSKKHVRSCVEDATDMERPSPGKRHRSSANNASSLSPSRSPSPSHSSGGRKGDGNANNAAAGGGKPTKKASKPLGRPRRAPKPGKPLKDPQLDMDPDDPSLTVKEARKIRNRLSAAASRQRQREFVEELEAKVKELEERNKALCDRVHTLETQLQLQSQSQSQSQSQGQIQASPSWNRHRGVMPGAFAAAAATAAGGSPQHEAPFHGHGNGHPSPSLSPSLSPPLSPPSTYHLPTSSSSDSAAPLLPPPACSGSAHTASIPSQSYSGSHSHTRLLHASSSCAPSPSLSPSPSPSSSSSGEPLASAAMPAFIKPAVVAEALLPSVVVLPVNPDFRVQHSSESAVLADRERHPMCASLSSQWAAAAA